MANDNSNADARPPGESSAATATVEGPSGWGSRTWLWVVVAFAVQAAVWTAWLLIAAQNKVQSVPLEPVR